MAITTRYDSKRRFISYWHQIDEVLTCEPQHMLDVGVGTGFLSRYLRALDIAVTTVDIDKERKPDIVASVTALPCSDNVFDMVTAFEVLEHMPYEESLQSMRELHRVSSHWVLISLPDATRYLRLEVPIPKIGKWKRLYTISLCHPERHKMGEEGHYWEIGKAGYPLARIIQDMETTGFAIKKKYRVFENPYHHFFVLQKI